MRGGGAQNYFAQGNIFPSSGTDLDHLLTNHLVVELKRIGRPSSKERHKQVRTHNGLNGHPEGQKIPATRRIPVRCGCKKLR